MSGEAVSQCVRMDPILETGVVRGFLAGIPHYLGSDGMMGGVPTPAGEYPFFGLAFQPTPIFTQGSERGGTEHDFSVLPPFPAADVDDHAAAVDIGDLQAGQLGTPYPRAIERH